MKKSLRILSLVLAVVMMMSSLSVLGSAFGENDGYSAYRGDNANLNYDDANAPVYTIDQYASMALDEIDRMLVDADLGVIDIYVGTLELESVDGTVTSVSSLLKTVDGLLSAGLLGDAGQLATAAKALTQSKWALDNGLSNAAFTKRYNGDITVLWDLLDLIGGVENIVYKYAMGTIDVGILNGLIGEYIFNVRELIFGLLYGVTGMGDTVDAEGNKVKYDYFDTFEIPAKYQGNNTSMIFLQDVLNTLVLGEWKQLDDLFYEAGHKDSNVVYSEYMFHDGSAAGALVTDAMDTANYDYYGWVHPDEWVTFGLGDAIRVTKGTAAPAPSYTKVNVQALPTTYDLVENLLLLAYNGIAVPVLNRITANWLREEMGYEFDDLHTEKWKKDVKWENGAYYYPESEWYDEDGNKVKNPEYDYFYTGKAPEDIDYESSGVYKIFNPENLHIPYASLDGYSTFIEALNHNAGKFVKAIVNATSTENGAVTTYSWTDPTDTEISYSFTWTDGGNSLLLPNIIQLLRFVLKITGGEFFDKYAEARGEIKTAAQIDAMSDQAVLAYIIRAIINSSVDYMFIPENDETNTIAGAGLEACIQLAAQDLPGVDYTKPLIGSYATYEAYADACIDKALAILLDVAAFKLNCELDTEYATINKYGDGYIATNSGSKNQTGLLGVQGDSGVYGTNAGALIAWAITNWASAKQRNTQTGAQSNTYQCLLNVDFTGDNQGGAYNGFNEDTLWSDLDLLLNALIPIDQDNTSTANPDNRPWIYQGIASQPIVSKAFILDYLVRPIVNLDFDNIYTIFMRNPDGAFNYDNLEVVIIDLLNRVFDLIFPNVFMKSCTTIDSVLNNENLAKMASDLIVTLSATKSKSQNTANGGTINGRGMLIADVALPIVCLVLGLKDNQDFEELENYIPETINSNDASTYFVLYNGSSGVNTSYRDKNDDFKRKIDKLYTFTISSAAVNIVSGPTSDVQIKGITNGATKISGGESFSGAYLSGYLAGQTLQIIIKYTVSDENGQTLGTTQTLTSYTYVSNGAAVDDDSTGANGAAAINGKVISYPTNLYITGGLSSIEGLSYRVKDNKTAANVKVTGVSVSGANTNWASLVTYDAAAVAANNKQEKAKKAKVDQDLDGKEGTYVFTPFAVDPNAKRNDYDYQKDADGKYVLDSYGLKIRTGLKALADPAQYYVPDGEYTVTATFNVGGQTGSVTTKVHVYNDFGLPGLVDSCISANRASETLTADGQGYWSTYESALLSAIGFVYPPKTFGNDFANHIAASSSANMNKYEELYKTLYLAANTIPGFEQSAGAASIWNSVNAKRPYNYTRESYTAGDSTVYYQKPVQYYENGYKFVSTCNYVSHTFTPFRKAVNHANDLINREYKYVGLSEAAFNDLTAAEKQNFINKNVADYNAQVAAAKPISSVEAAYALHMLDLTYNRLIPVAGDNRKLQAAYTQFGNEVMSGYSSGSWTAYSNAKTFAGKVLANDQANPDEINTAMNKLIETWKELLPAADYSALEAEISTQVAFINANADGWGYSANSGFNPDEAVEQTIYNQDTYAAYLTALKAGKKMIDDRDNGLGLGSADQGKIDSAIQAIRVAKEGLLPYGQGEGGDEATFDVNSNAKFECGEGFVSPVVNTTFLGTFDILTYNYNNNNIAYNGVIYGLPRGCTEADLVVTPENPNGIFTLDGCELELIPGAKGKASSGSVAIIKDSKDGRVLAIYILAFRGDLNGDGNINATDKKTYSLYVANRDGYCFTDNSVPECVFLPALDLDGNAKVNASDNKLAQSQWAGVKTVNQVTGGYMD